MRVSASQPIVKMTAHWAVLVGVFIPLGRFFRRGLDHRDESRLGFGVAVEQQRIVGSATHRPVVLPGVRVGDAP